MVIGIMLLPADGLEYDNIQAHRKEPEFFSLYSMMRVNG